MADVETPRCQITGAFIAKCRADISCGYAWIVGFLPMNGDRIGKAAGPMCGDSRPMLGGGEKDLHPTLQAHLAAMVEQSHA